MPFYLTFGIRIPDALVGFFARIGFVEFREAGNPPEHIRRAFPIGRMPPTARTLLEDMRAGAKPAAIDIDPQPQCALLSKLPPELRNMIFREVLVSSRPIQKAVHLIGPERDRLRDKEENGLLKSTDPRPADDIDSALLRTCYRAYEEGRDVLYGGNTFHFTRRGDIVDFKSLAVFRPTFGEGRKSNLVSYRSHKDGRLSSIRKLSLKLEGLVPWSTRSYVEIDWTDFFTKQPGLPCWNIHFPVLEELMVDFTGLELRSEEDNWLNAFVRKLETFGKLQKLTVRGVSHPKTLDSMCERMVRDDGEFCTIVG